MKKCPNPECSFQVDRRKCPQTCPWCKALLMKVLKEPPPVPLKNVRGEKVVVVKHPTMSVEEGLYSVQYHQHNRYVLECPDLGK